MEKAEPPSQQSSPHSSLFRVGKNSHGNWVVRDQQGLRGGIFVDRAEALKFAMFENGNRSHAVIMVPGVLELDINTSHAAQHMTAETTIGLQRCQSAFKFDPRSASNFDPFGRRVRAVALAPSELVGVAETARARVVW
jgi:hypothetical protein